MKPFDIAVIAAYLVIMAGVGFWFMRRNKDVDAYFLAGGRLPWWVVSLSIYATMFPGSLACIEDDPFLCGEKMAELAITLLAGKPVPRITSLALSYHPGATFPSA